LLEVDAECEKEPPPVAAWGGEAPSKQPSTFPEWERMGSLHDWEQVYAMQSGQATEEASQSGWAAASPITYCGQPLPRGWEADDVAAEAGASYWQDWGEPQPHTEPAAAAAAAVPSLARDPTGPSDVHASLGAAAQKETCAAPAEPQDACGRLVGDQKNGRVVGAKATAALQSAGDRTSNGRAQHTAPDTAKNLAAAGPVGLPLPKPKMHEVKESNKPHDKSTVGERNAPPAAVPVKHTSAPGGLKMRKGQPPAAGIPVPRPKPKS